MKIFHNPRCSKSRQTLQLIEASGKEVEVIEYLTNSPSKKELASIIKLLGIKPEELVRKGEDIYKEQFKGRSLSDDEWINAMVNYPKLIERPIVIDGQKAVIGRPPEKVLELL